MRLRNERLTTGHLYTVFHDVSDRSRNSSLLFLVEGAKDVETLDQIANLCLAHPSKPVPKPVGDQGMLRSVDRDVTPATVYRMEARELAGLDDSSIRDVLVPALDRLAAGERELFPAASGAVGAPARGVHLLDRAEDICAVVDLIGNGHDVEVVGPRRFGKTSVLLRLEEELGDSYEPVYVELQHDSTLDGFAARVRRRVSGCKGREAASEVSQNGWQTVLRDVGVGLRRKSGRTPVLLLDEVVYFLEELGSAESEREQNAQLFFDGLRAVAEASGCRFVLAGSVPLSTYLRTLRAEVLLTAIPGLQLHHFAPLSQACHRVLIRQILIGSRLVPEAGDLEWLGANLDLSLPFPSLRFLVQVGTRVEQGGSLSSGDLDDEMKKFLAETESFDDLAKHLDRHPDKSSASRDTVVATLDRIVESGDQGVVEEEIRNLVGDENYLWLFKIWPLCAKDGNVRAASPFWCRWWRSRS